MLFTGLIFIALIMRRLKAERGAVGEELARMRNNKKNWFRKMRSAVKIFTSFYQITSQFEDTLSARFPEGEYIRSLASFSCLSNILQSAPLFDRDSF